MKSFWISLEQTLNERSLRERWLILITLLVVVYLVFDAVAFSPMLKKIKADQVFIEARQKSVQWVEEQKNLDQKKAQAQETATQNKIQALQQEILKNKSLVESSLMSEKTVEILNKMFEQEKKIKVLLVETEAAKPMEEAEGLYHHTLNVHFEGGFFDVMAFIEKIERFPVPILFEQVLYQVKAYPTAKVELKLGFMSHSQSFARFHHD